MPTCPGCGLNVPHRQLDTHQRYCEGLTAEDGLGTSAEVLDRELLEMERRLERRIQRIEAALQNDSIDWSVLRERNGRSDRYRR